MIICLTGMHRSGTSLMSSYLEKCGINMGEKLVGAMKGNMRGHFEDTDFVDLHNAILAENRCHMYSPKKKLSISDIQTENARRIVKNKQKKFSHFGWKDPRTTLFLDFWAKMLPDCKFVLLYREPWSVIDSLRRRGSDRRIRIMPWLPAYAWLKYNQAILNFYNTHPNNSILISINGFNSHHEESRRHLSDFLGYELSIPYTDVYRRDEIVHEASASNNPLHRLTDMVFSKQLVTTLQKLESVADINSKGPEL